ncbi:hypothetical protein BRAS3843_300001 [Bradyrhizobium sp. STM 3843]|nr:hypothetical protein BRAS3843_300001 [Bradyrhizobium sp. STM 3843]
MSAGCGGRVGVAARLERADERYWRGREIVWSWHPDAGVKFAMMLLDIAFAMRGHRADDGGQQARCTEESTYKR